MSVFGCSWFVKCLCISVRVCLCLFSVLLLLDANQFSYHLLLYMLQSTKTAAQDLLNMLQGMLPQPNFMPPSLHLMREMLGVEDWSKYEHHLCHDAKCKGYVWQNIGRDEWDDHRHDKCPNCSGPRFKTIDTAGTTLCVDRAIL